MATGCIPPLKCVLRAGNTTEGKSIVLSPGDAIEAEQLSLKGLDADTQVAGDQVLNVGKDLDQNVGGATNLTSGSYSLVVHGGSTSFTADDGYAMLKTVDATSGLSTSIESSAGRVDKGTAATGPPKVGGGYYVVSNVETDESILSSTSSITPSGSNVIIVEESKQLKGDGPIVGTQGKPGFTFLNSVIASSGNSTHSLTSLPPAPASSSVSSPASSSLRSDFAARNFSNESSSQAIVSISNSNVIAKTTTGSTSTIIQLTPSSSALAADPPTADEEMAYIQNDPYQIGHSVEYNGEKGDKISSSTSTAAAGTFVSLSGSNTLTITGQLVNLVNQLLDGTPLSNGSSIISPDSIELLVEDFTGSTSQELNSQVAVGSQVGQAIVNANGSSFSGSTSIIGFPLTRQGATARRVVPRKELPGFVSKLPALLEKEKADRKARREARLAARRGEVVPPQEAAAATSSPQVEVPEDLPIITPEEAVSVVPSDLTTPAAASAEAAPVQVSSNDLDLPGSGVVSTATTPSQVHISADEVLVTGAVAETSLFPTSNVAAPEFLVTVASSQGAGATTSTIDLTPGTILLQAQQEGTAEPAVAISLDANSGILTLDAPRINLTGSVITPAAVIQFVGSTNPGATVVSDSWTARGFNSITTDNLSVSLSGDDQSVVTIPSDEIFVRRFWVSAYSTYFNTDLAAAVATALEITNGEVISYLAGTTIFGSGTSRIEGLIDVSPTTQLRLVYKTTDSNARGLGLAYPGGTISSVFASLSLI